MCRELQRIKMHCRVPMRKPLISAEMQKFVCRSVEKEDTRYLRNESRLCDQMNHMTPYFVLIEDVEFEIEDENPSCPNRTVQGRGGSITMWNMFYWHGNGVLVSSRLNKQPRDTYLDILCTLKYCNFILRVTYTIRMIMTPNIVSEKCSKLVLL
ncbi:hypothetical protein TNCV_4053761 [Trichonephila clavipes]|nr:hypothetical protein TNCV_4053761 [Trichonephila clavipes]